MELNRTDLHQKKKDGPWEPRRFPGVSEDDHKKWVWQLMLAPAVAQLSTGQNIVQKTFKLAPGEVVGEGGEAVAAVAVVRTTVPLEGRTRVKTP